MPKNRRILLLERPDVGPALAGLLQQQDFQVAYVSTAEEAIRAFDQMLARNEEPWLVITGALVNVNAGEPACLPLIEHCARSEFTGGIVGMSSIENFVDRMCECGAGHILEDKSKLVEFVRGLWSGQRSMRV